MSKKSSFKPTVRHNTVNHIITKQEVEDIINGVFILMNQKQWRQENIPLISINNLQYYIYAFTHRSFQNEQKELAAKSALPVFVPAKNYELLEFLGDSVLNSVITWYLYEIFKEDGSEHIMTRLKIRLIKREQLAKFACWLGFQKYILISSYLESLESKGQGRHNPALQEDVFEAFLGAIICDFGFEYGYVIAKNFILGILEECVNIVELLLNNDNYKDSLIQYYTANGWGQAEFQELIRIGPQNNCIFHMILLLPDAHFQNLSQDLQLKIKINQARIIENIVSSEFYMQVGEKLKQLTVEENRKYIIAIGIGKSKKEGEQECSKFALELFQVNPNFPIIDNLGN